MQIILYSGCIQWGHKSFDVVFKSCGWHLPTREPEQELLPLQENREVILCRFLGLGLKKLEASISWPLEHSPGAQSHCVRNPGTVLWGRASSLCGDALWKDGERQDGQRTGRWEGGREGGLDHLQLFQPLLGRLRSWGPRDWGREKPSPLFSESLTQRREELVINRCFKPLSFGVICYMATDNQNNLLPWKESRLHCKVGKANCQVRYRYSFWKRPFRVLYPYRRNIFAQNTPVMSSVASV